MRLESENVTFCGCCKEDSELCKCVDSVCIEDLRSYDFGFNAMEACVQEREIEQRVLLKFSFGNSVQRDSYYEKGKL